MRSALLFVVAAVVISGCSRDDGQAPIADSTFVELLVEMHLANGRIEITDSPLPVDRDSILLAYGVDSTAYAETIAFYSERTEEYSQLYGRVLDRLSAERMPLDGPAMDGVRSTGGELLPDAPSQSDTLTPSRN